MYLRYIWEDFPDVFILPRVAVLILRAHLQVEKKKTVLQTI